MATRTCPVCMAEVDDSQSVCPDCGASMTDDSADGAAPAGFLATADASRRYRMEDV